MKINWVTQEKIVATATSAIKKFREVKWRKLALRVLFITLIFGTSFAISGRLIGGTNTPLSTALKWVGGELLVLLLLLIVVGLSRRRRAKKLPKRTNGEGKRFLPTIPRPAVRSVLRFIVGILVIGVLLVGIINKMSSKTYYGRFDIGDWALDGQAPPYPNTNSWGYRGEATVRKGSFVLRFEKDLNRTAGLGGTANGVIITKEFEIDKVSNMEWWTRWRENDKGDGNIGCSMYASTLDCDFTLIWKGPDGLVKTRKAVFHGR